MFEEIVEEGGNYSGESQLDVEGRLARLCVGLHAWAVSEYGDHHTDISLLQPENDFLAKSANQAFTFSKA